MVDDTQWFGYGGFTRALQALVLPDVRMSQHFLWDHTRHDAPASGAARHDVQPDAVARVTQGLKLPTMPAATWRSVHAALAAFVSAYEFNLNEATRWARDRVVESGTRVNRQSVGVVARGATFGGCPLYRQPPPTSEEIGAAFVDNILNRAAAADIDLGADDVQVVRIWFGPGHQGGSNDDGGVAAEET